MLRAFAAAAALMIGMGAAQATTVDFTSLGSRDLGQSEVALDGVRVRSGSDSLFVGAGGVRNSICALDVTAFSCANDLELRFDNFATEVMFTIGGFQPGDLIVATVETGRGAPAQIRIEDGGVVDLSGLGGIRSIFFDDRSYASGVSYGALRYVEVAAVPLPASLPLLLAGLGAIAVARRRRSR